MAMEQSGNIIYKKAEEEIMGRKEHGRDEKHSRRDRRKKKGGIISTVILIVANVCVCIFCLSAV